MKNGIHLLPLPIFRLHASLVWARTLANSSANSTSGFDVALDDQGNVYASGIFGGLSIDFDPGPGVFNMSEAGAGYNGFVSKFDANGNFSWARQIVPGDSTGTLPNSLDVDPLGNVFVTGKFGTNFRLRSSGSDIIGPIAGVGGGDIFLAKLDTLGASRGGDQFGRGRRRGDRSQRQCTDHRPLPRHGRL